MEILLFALGILLGGIGVWWYMQSKAAAVQKELTKTREQLVASSAQRKAEATAAAEKERYTEVARQQLENSFGNLARKALQDNTEMFLTQAKEKLDTQQKKQNADLELRKKEIELLLKPVQENLQALEKNNRELENRRERAYGELGQQLVELSKATQRLQGSNHELVTALKGSSQARGRWGEVSLRKIAELAGMTEHIDFIEQQTVGSDARPDMVVHLPQGGCIPVDAKVPLTGFLEAAETTDPQSQKQALRNHAAQLKSHVRELVRRNYPAKLESRVDFTILFLPGDAFLSEAFRVDPELQIEALDKKVLIATPVTLMALLRTVSVYWQQQAMAENAEKVWEAAKTLYERTATFGEHLGGVYRGLDQAIKNYNKAVGSFNRQVLPAGRRLVELQKHNASTKKLEEQKEVESALREPPSPKEMEAGG